MNLGRIFDPDNSVFSFFGKIGDLLALSFVWTLCCIPIVTIGPASTALYYTVVKVIRRERGSLMKEYFHCLKTNFRQGLLLTLILAGYGMLTAAVVWASGYMDTGTELDSLYYYISRSFYLPLILVLLYIFPYLSRFQDTLSGCLKKAFFLSIRHLMSTLVMAAFLISSVILTYNFPLFLIILPGLNALLDSLLIERVFKRYMPEPQEGEDPWYWE